MDETRRAVAWVKDDLFGVEFAEIDLGPQYVTAEGVAIAAGPLPYCVGCTNSAAYRIRSICRKIE